MSISNSQAVSDVHVVNISFLGYKSSKPYVVFAVMHTSVHSFWVFTLQPWATFAFKRLAAKDNMNNHRQNQPRFENE